MVCVGCLWRESKSPAAAGFVISPTMEAGLDLPQELLCAFQSERWQSRPQ